jgi:hypothetical protein
MNFIHIIAVILAYINTFTADLNSILLAIIALFFHNFVLIYVYKN